MELKSEMVAKGEKVYLGSNRTFMELKFSCINSVLLVWLVLIVPLWN